MVWDETIKQSLKGLAMHKGIISELIKKIDNSKQIVLLVKLSGSNAFIDFKPRFVTPIEVNSSINANIGILEKSEFFGIEIRISNILYNDFKILLNNLLTNIKVLNSLDCKLRS